MPENTAPESVKASCYCGEMVEAEMRGTMSSERGTGEYFEGSCPKCGRYVQVSVFPE